VAVISGVNEFLKWGTNLCSISKLEKTAEEIKILEENN
jgi:hypothetical protein